MADERLRYVDTDVDGGAGDGTSLADAYATLVACEAAEDNGNGDLVTADVYLRVLCYATAGTADTAQSTWSGFETSATCYIKIEGATGHRPVISGWTTNNYRIDEPDDSGIRLYEDYMRVDGLQIEAADYCITWGVDGAYYEISNCRLQNGTYGIYHSRASGSATTNMWNIIVDTMGTDGVYIRTNAEGAGNLYNSILYGCTDDGFQDIGSVTKAVNVASFGNGDDWLNVDTITTCADDDGDASVSPLGGDWLNEFVNAAAGNFTLVASGNCEGGGTDDPGDPLYDTDMEGNAYISTWSIGVDAKTVGGETHPLAGTIANSTVIDGAIIANRKLLGDFANTSSLSGSAILSRALSGSFANTATPSGNIFRTRLLSGDIASLSSLIASTLNRTRPISGSFDGQAALTGAIEKVLMFTGAFGATSALSGDIYLVSGLSGQIDIVSTVTGEVITIRGLSGDTGGLSAFSASLILGGEVTLSGDIIGDSTFSGPIYLTRRFSGNIDSLSALDGNLVAIRGLSGLVGAISDFSASLILGGEITLSGSVAGGSVFSGSVYLTRGISGSIDAISAISGDAIAVRMLSGIVDAVSDLSGNAILAKALAGIIDGVSILSGVLEPEEVAFGIVTITLAESKATITFTASKPDIAFSESKPRINFN